MTDYELTVILTTLVKLSADPAYSVNVKMFYQALIACADQQQVLSPSLSHPRSWSS